MNHEFFDNGMSDFQHDTPNSLMPLAMTTQHPLSSITGPNMGLSSCDVGPAFQGGREWNVALQRNGTDDPLPSLLSYHSSNNASHVSNSSPTEGRPSSSSSHELDNMGPTAAVERPLKQRRIMPKSMNDTSETIGVVGGMNASLRTAKRRGRKGELSKKTKDKASKMRQKTACAACFASHVEVSCHRCGCRTVCLTVVQVL